MLQAVVLPGLITVVRRAVVVIARAPGPYGLGQHKDDGSAQNAAKNDQKQFHGVRLTNATVRSIPASDSRRKSANLAALGSYHPGNSADVSLLQGSALMDPSEKEDIPWMTSRSLRPALEAVSGFLLPRSLLYWFYSMRFLQAGPLIRQQIPHQLAPHRPSKMARLRHLPFQRPTKTTHARTIKGGPRVVSALGVSAGVHTPSVRNLYAKHIPEMKVLPC